MAYFRGMDGSVTVGGVTVLQLEQWSFSAQIEELETTVMGDAWKTVVGGVSSFTGSATAKLDNTGAQNTLITSLLTASPAGTTASIRFRISATKYFDGTCLLKNISVPNAMGTITKITFDFTGSGALTPTWG